MLFFLFYPCLRFAFPLSKVSLLLDMVGRSQQQLDNKIKPTGGQVNRMKQEENFGIKKIS